MDYKYIEQLLERYWQCQTSVEEERILRDFFSQKEVPAHLQRYCALFAFEKNEEELHLGADFDRKILNRIEEPVVKARRNTIRFRLTPFYRAAAIVAVVLCLGLAAQHSFQNDTKQPGVSYNYAGYQDTYSDPQVALDQVSSALKTVSHGLRESGLHNVDSALVDGGNDDKM
ncbi:MAG: hypothetical protein WCR53_08360 [Bacteroidaceae bacterium]|jgi:hypothetical protein|nr:hypothetical protein [Bacteroidaceae bacterium]